ncbi:MAG: Uma2 family endonuclease [Trichocoleus desertorum ATA4-8-CV12]|jgi:Uma2 family endonuclease|nr:Uma2 family endonuclease [Trichocoleus desertorum ATA4-8-CV12]
MTIATPTLGEQRIILHNVSWRLFELMLSELGETSNARLAYDQGILEIMSPLFPHEHIKRLIEKLIDVLVEELDLPIRSAGALTCKRKDLLKGIEPDSCFYIQNESKVRALETIDLDRDPPPDLVLEVDFSSSSLNKEPIYVALGVPEIWRYANGELTIKQLQQGQYTQLSYSPTFGNLLLTVIPRFLNQSPAIGETGVIRTFRSWVREQRV